MKKSDCYFVQRGWIEGRESKGSGYKSMVNLGRVHDAELMHGTRVCPTRPLHEAGYCVSAGDLARLVGHGPPTTPSCCANTQIDTNTKLIQCHTLKCPNAIPHSYLIPHYNTTPAPRFWSTKHHDGTGAAITV